MNFSPVGEHEISLLWSREPATNPPACYLRWCNPAPESDTLFVRTRAILLSHLGLHYTFLYHYSIGLCTLPSLFFIIKPARCTNFTGLFWHETLHVSDSSSVHHQEFIHCTLSNGICHTRLYTTFKQDHPVPSWSCSKAVYNLCDIYHC